MKAPASWEPQWSCTALAIPPLQLFLLCISPHLHVPGMVKQAIQGTEV